jgi:signal transduction histidine kinase
MSRVPRRGRLFRKYAVVIILLVGGVLLVSSAVNLVFSYGETKAALIRVQRQQVLAAASRIEQFVAGIERQVRAAMEVPFTDAAAARAQREIDFLRLLRDAPAITEIFQLDTVGKEQLLVSRFASNEIGSQRDRSRDPSFMKTRIGRAYFGPVSFRNESMPYTTVAVPWGEGAPEVAAAEVDLRAILPVISQIRVGATGYVYVVDQRGVLVAHPDMSLVLQQRDLSGLPQIRAARGAPTPRDVVTETTGLRGGRVLTSHAAIEPLGWLVFAEQPLAEAFAPLQGAVVLSGIFFVVGLGLSVLASVVLARRMVAPIRVLQEGAARIGAGELGHRIDVRTGDELETLGEEFNRTAARLEESYANLEQKVEARTRELADANAELNEALEQLKALREVAQAVNSTLDLQTVLNTIAARAVGLSGASGGVIYDYEEATREFSHIIGAYGLDDDLRDVLSAAPMRFGEGASGKAVAQRAPVQVADVLSGGSYDVDRVRAVFERHGYRSLLAVPLLFETQIVGSLVVWGREAGGFPQEIVELLQTFATQSVLAIQNARLFREIEVKSKELEVASQHKSEFLANMSHELRTPLNAIIGFSEVLTDRMFGELNEKQEEYLRDIYASGTHLLSLINDILDLSKIEAGRMELELTDFDLPTALDNALTLVRERAGRRGITLQTMVDARLGEVRADERKIRQVVLNLLSNAIKFTPEGGRIEVAAVPKEAFVEVSVSDTGVGIAPDDQEAVFEEFRQVVTADKKAEGTGLGLTLCRKFIELHGGRIWVKSQVGVGSTFTFMIPVRRAG